MDPLSKLMLLEAALEQKDPEHLVKFRGLLDSDAGYFSDDLTVYSSWVEGPEGEHFIDVIEDLLGSLAVDALTVAPVVPGNLLRPSALAAL